MSAPTAHRTVWQLARLADCHDPDRLDTPGAEWLQLVARAAVDRWEETDRDEREDDDWAGDTAHEIADDSVPVYTHQRWLTFVDLCAYDEDTDELCGDQADMTERAGVALYLIGARLAGAVLEELGELACDEDSDRGDQDAA